MSSKTKIVVLRMKEIIYTAIFIGLGIILVTLLFIMFRPKKEPQTVSSGQVQAAQASYTPGLYRASLSLGSQNADLEVAVDADHINSVSMTPLSDSVETMYPLMAPALEQLSEQNLLLSVSGKPYISRGKPVYMLCPGPGHRILPFKGLQPVERQEKRMRSIWF